MQAYVATYAVIADKVELKIKNNPGKAPYVGLDKIGVPLKKANIVSVYDKHYIPETGKVTAHAKIGTKSGHIPYSFTYWKNKVFGLFTSKKK